MIVKINPVDQPLGFYCKEEDAKRLFDFVWEIGSDFVCCEDIFSDNLKISYVQYGPRDPDNDYLPQFSFCNYIEWPFEFMSYEDIMTRFSVIFTAMKRDR